MEAKRYTIKSFKKAGEPKQSQFGELQAWWVSFNESQDDALWNKKADTGEPQIGEVWGRLEKAVSQANKVYYKFKKMPRPEGASSTVPMPLEADTPGEIVRKLDEILSILKAGSVPDPIKDSLNPLAAPQPDLPPVSVYEDTVVDQLTDGEVDLNDIPF